MPTHTSSAVNVGQLVFAPQRVQNTKTGRLCFFARGAAARRCSRINGVVEDSGEGVIDVADDVIQLVLGL